MKNLNFCSTITKLTGHHCLFFTAFLAIGLLVTSNRSFAQTQDSLLSLHKLKQLSLEELMNIKVVSATGSEQSISEAPSTMIVITAKQIEERGYEQLDDVLRDIPGVDIVHIYGQATSFITFRGMYGDENRRAVSNI